ncbi:MAG: protoporphyrinogen oxidase HemJ [Alphaproteobacteria bacterium]|nr:protoporphyrinogen oxidase HemJ [Alphaproteobacteria bacterium]
MSRWLAAVYPWIKAAHILAVIAWMAGLLYLPRLFVYHAMTPIGSGQSETFKIMERRLQRGIMSPAMIATLLFGALIAATPGIVDWHRGWIWAKLGLVTGLVAYHHQLAWWRRAFADDHNRHSPRFFRIANELPTIVLIAIVILVVVKPF